MKKLLTFILLAASILCIAAAVSACSENGSGHEHDFGELTVVVAPTCTEDGEGERTCSVCGAKINEIIQKTGHVLQYTHIDNTHTHTVVCARGDYSATEDCDMNTVTIPSTCTTGGYVEHECAACKYGFKTDETEALGHSYGEFGPSGVHGVHVKVCTRKGCGATVSGMCEYTDAVTPATCSSGERVKHVCGICGDEYTEESSPALPHNLSNWEFTGENSNPDGVHTHERHCLNDGCTYKEEGNCVFSTYTLDPTCTDDGYTTYTCDTCGHLHDKQIKPALKHDYPEEWTYLGENTHERLCRRCGDRQEGSCELEETTVPPTCTNGEIITKSCKYCTNSQNQAGDEVATDHSWGVWTHEEVDGVHKHYRECLKCGEKAYEVCAFTAVTTQSTCDAGGYTTYTCDACSHSYTGDHTDALTHNFSGWQSDRSGNHYKICMHDGCGEVVTEECQYTSIKTDPTCDAAGYTTYTCGDCGYEYTEEGEEALGHDMTGWIFTGDHENPDGVHTHTNSCKRCAFKEEGVCSFATNTVDPTCTEDGYTEYTCPVCNHYHDKQIKEKLGHDYPEEWTHIAGTDTHERFCRRCEDRQEGNCELVETESAPPTCTSDEIVTLTCRYCSNSKNAAGDEVSAGHKWGGWKYELTDGEHKHYHVCEVCSERAYEACSFTAVTTQSTCTDGGYTTYTCDGCSHSYIDNPTGPTEHTYDKWTPVDGSEEHTHSCLVCGNTETDACEYKLLRKVDPTCTENGYSVYLCAECGSEKKSDTVEKYDHDFTGWSYAGVEDGKHIHTRTCSRENCGVIEKGVCTDDDPVVTEPNCSRGGYTTYTCDECHGTYTDDPTPRGDHQWGPWKVGYGKPYHHTRTCTVCKLDNSQLCHMVTEITEADCENDGQTVVKCSECDRTPVITVHQKLGHDFPDEYTHNAGTDTHSRTCRRENCGKTETDQCEMVTSTTPYTCTTSESITESCLYCSNSRTSEGQQAPGHKWSGWLHREGTETHYHECSVCRQQVEESCNYSETIVPADCTTMGHTLKKCDACQNEIKVYDGSSAFGHEWESVWEITDGTHKNKCRRCNTEFNGAHDYSETNICSLCGHDGLEYQLSDSGTYYIVLNDNNVHGAKKIIIPETYGENNYPVKEIASGMTSANGKLNGFINNKNLKEVELPENLEAIRSYAFASCENLVKVTVRNEDGNEYSPSLQLIEDNAFSNCKKLISAANLPETLKIIGGSAFRYCSALTEISIPIGVEVIGAYAFADTAFVKDKTHWTGNTLYINKHLLAVENVGREFEIAEGTVTVGAGVFKNATTLKSLTMHAGVKTVDSDAFLGCALDEVTFTGTLGEWLSINFMNEHANPVKSAKTFNISGAEAVIEIPDGTTSIPDGTFRNNDKITSVTIPESVTYIGAYAFDGCTSLQTVTVKSKNITFIGRDAFRGTKFFTETQRKNGGLYLETEDGQASYLIAADAQTETLNVQENCLIIAEYALYGCTSLKNLATGNRLTVICGYAFAGCTSLAGISFGESLKTIYANAFAGCTSISDARFAKKASWLGFNSAGAGRGKTVGPDVNSATDLKLNTGKWTFSYAL